MWSLIFHININTFWTNWGWRLRCCIRRIQSMMRRCISACAKTKMNSAASRWSPALNTFLLLFRLRVRDWHSLDFDMIWYGCLVDFSWRSTLSQHKGRMAKNLPDSKKEVHLMANNAKPWNMEPKRSANLLISHCSLFTLPLIFQLLPLVEAHLCKHDSYH